MHLYVRPFVGIVSQAFGQDAAILQTEVTSYRVVPLLRVTSRSSPLSLMRWIRGVGILLPASTRNPVMASMMCVMVDADSIMYYR